MTGPEAEAKLDRMLGLLGALGARQDETVETVRDLGERIVRLEEGVTATKEVVEAWTAAKTSLRFMKWFAGLVAALVGIIAAIKSWPHR
jgi:hypothetical protein